MATTRITLRNYRCFEDSSPASIDLGPGFTAFVGQNNSGKSSLLKFFYEYRDFLSHIGPNGNFINLIAGGNDASGVHGLHDSLEVFSDSNDRRMEIQFDCLPASSPALSRVVFEAERNSPQVWRAKFARGGQPLSIAFREEIGGFQGNNLLASNGSTMLDCSVLFDLAQSIRQSTYVGPFRNAINQGSAPYYDIVVGNQFVQNWDNWKSGNSKIQNLAVSRVTDDIRHIFDFEQLEISASPDKQTLHLTIDRRPYKLNEVGAGIAHFIIVLGNAMISRPEYVLIDEPELSLHPALQIDFLTTLASYAKRGVIFATHSVGLARSVSERIYTFQRTSGSVAVTPFEQTPDYVEFLGEMSFSSYKELGYDRVLLVEGVHDVRTAHQFLRKLGKDHQVVVLPLGGDQLARGGVEQELGEVKRLSSKISVLVDSEKDSASSPATPARVAFESLCNKLGFDVCVTERRAIENYLSDRAIKRVLGPKYSQLTAYQKLKDGAMSWGKGENWRIAREMELPELGDTDVGRFFERI